MRPDIQAGSPFPDFELPDHTDTPRKLSFLQGDDPMILTLGRGISCPKDRNQYRQLRDFYDQLVIGYVRLVTITTDDLQLINDLRYGAGAQWPFLHDEGRTVLRDLDIAEYTSGSETMVPHTIVLEPGLKVFRIYDGYWYWGRPSTAELHADLREVSRRCRFDYDLGDPQVRAAWDRGEEDKFFPYGVPKPDMFARMAGAFDTLETRGE